jgi:hypothetical protein
MGRKVVAMLARTSSQAAIVGLALLQFWSAPIGAQSRPDLAPPRCDYGEPHPNAPPELAQFAFLVGDFEITLHAWRNGAWTPPRPGPGARWNGWYGLGGMAIYDEWYDPDPGIDRAAPRGVNVRMYDPEAEEWQMMWIATGGLQVQDLRAEMRDGKLTMWQVYPDRPDFRADFTVEDTDHWYRTSYVPGDNGEWQPQFKLAASRIPCG